MKFEFDEVSGQEIIGYEWNGIKELNMLMFWVFWIWFWVLIVVVVFLWVFYLFFFLISDYLKGIIGYFLCEVVNVVVVEGEVKCVEVYVVFIEIDFDILVEDLIL